MSAHRALIVDDSRTAQLRLSKMLEQYDLSVDTTLSAEEALSYLSAYRPTVVFMDHHMEGMNGLEALRIIKSNPDTALIPVIMYTSESGDLYVGQARALGALDILGKEAMKQSSLEKVLERLGVPALAAANEPVAQPKKKSGSFTPRSNKRGRRYTDAAKVLPNTGQRPVMGATEMLENVRHHVSNLFEMHITRVRQEIEDSSQLVLRQVTKELDKHRSTSQDVNTDAVPTPEPVVELEREDSFNHQALPYLLGAVALAVSFAGYQMYSSNQLQTSTKAQLSTLTDHILDQEIARSSISEVGQLQAPAIASVSANGDRPAVFDSLSLAVNLNQQVGYGETPFDSERIPLVQDLLTLLSSNQFAGTVSLETHLGDYCVVQGSGGEWVLPQGDTNLSDCTFISTMVSDVSVADQTSISFMNFLNTTPVLKDGQILMDLSTQNYSFPSYSYPENDYATTAGEWNRIAQKNNRLEITF